MQDGLKLLGIVVLEMQRNGLEAAAGGRVQFVEQMRAVAEHDHHVRPLATAEQVENLPVLVLRTHQVDFIQDHHGPSAVLGYETRVQLGQAKTGAGNVQQAGEDLVARVGVPAVGVENIQVGVLGDDPLEVLDHEGLARAAAADHGMVVGNAGVVETDHLVDELLAFLPDQGLVRLIVEREHGRILNPLALAADPLLLFLHIGCNIHARINSTPRINRTCT